MEARSLSFNGDFQPWSCNGRQRIRGERRCHPLGNKSWKKKLHHQESVFDKKLREEASMQEENEREREKEKKCCGNEGKIGREVEL